MIIDLEVEQIQFLIKEIFPRLRSSPLVPKDARERIKRIQDSIESQFSGQAIRKVG